MTGYMMREPRCDKETLVNVVTDHIIGHRLTWELRNNTTLKEHPICQNNSEGQRIADKLVRHISAVASNIIREVNADLKS